MGYTVNKIHDKVNSPLYKEYICDTPSDIANLPTNKKSGQPFDEKIDKNYATAGSIVFVISTSDVYMLNTKGVWTKI